ncbi:MarR family winged helix-turn-helix transcriptional regulator [Derxia lacustris]|uniref:MarR family winged helix-turn-helix transcriptional regulator n=1 Tax=Derxia lacustris TaxID=764842 RepID=UPI000A175398|nr:MarR family winged helix-turn-helix transcriptional regulator [Derxia lacustris]
MNPTDPLDYKRALPTIRLLTRCFQAFERLSNANVRKFGLTGPQFDILATLGNTDGMTFRELGERTLITKGTLTGVVDRLEARGLVGRCAHESDGRSTRVRLTACGQALFEQVFPQQLAHCSSAFDAHGCEELAELNERLARLLHSLENFGGSQSAAANNGENDD